MPTVLDRVIQQSIVLVKSAKAARRVMASLVRYCEGRLKLVVNRAKSKCTQLKFCEFLSYGVDREGRLVWTLKALHRFKQRVREITRRNRGHRVQDVIDELRLYVVGWLNYYKLSCTYSVIKRLAEWVRRRVRLYYWKQWKAMSGGHSFKAARRVDSAWPCGRQAAAHASPQPHRLGHRPG